MKNFDSVTEIARDIAQELRAHPERWTQGYYARDRYGSGVGSQSHNAIKWCLTGHIYKRTRYTTLQNETELAFEEVIRKYGGALHIPTWNDNPKVTVEDVIAVCDEVAPPRQFPPSGGLLIMAARLAAQRVPNGNVSRRFGGMETSGGGWRPTSREHSEYMEKNGHSLTSGEYWKILNRIERGEKP